VNFTPINTNDRDLQLVQDSLARVIGQLINPLATGVLKKVSFTAVDSDVLVPHGFNSTNVAWMAGSFSVPAIIFTSPSKTNANQLILRCEQLPGVSTANAISAQNPLTAQVWAYLIG
jgi:hypothetical protein